MTEHFRFIVEMTAHIHDHPRGVGNREIYETVRRLSQEIAADGKLKTEMYKIIFLDLLFGDHYSEDIQKKIIPKKEKEIILPVAGKMKPQDASFFAELFSMPLREDLNETKDSVLRLFFSQFGHPEITAARLECVNPGKPETEFSNAE